MSLKSTLAQAAKPEAMIPAVLAMQPGKVPAEAAARKGVVQKRLIDDEDDKVDSSLLDAVEHSVEADGVVESGDGVVHLAQAATGTATDASPAAAGSVPTSSAGGATAAVGAGAGASAMAKIGVGLLAAGGVIWAADAISDSDDDDGDGGVQPSVVVSGSVIGGPVVPDNDLTVNLYRADGTTLLGSGALDATGQFSIDVGSYAGVVIAKVVNPNADPDYIDEATGQAVDLTANLMAVGVAAGGNVTLNINPLTTLAALKSGANFVGSSTGTPTTDVVNQTNDAVAQAFGLTDLTNTPVITTVDASGGANNAYDPDDGLNDAEKYGAILAALSGMDQSGSGQATIDDLFVNLDISGSTGTLNETALEAILSGAAVAAGNTDGNLLSTISDIFAKTSGTLGIDPIAGDNAINSAEKTAGVTLAGSNATGATVELSIGVNDREATVTGTNWSYTLVEGDYTAMGEGGETITATSTLTTGSGATATTTTTTATRTITIDTAAPTLTISSNDAALKAGETATITFSFSEAPVGFTAADITTTGGTLSELSSTADAKVYTATFTPAPNTASGNASITVAAGSYTDAAGNTGGAGTTPTISIDTLVPTLAIGSNVSAVKIGETATITFTFSEEPVGFVAGDITTTGGTLSGLAVSPTDAKVYTATFTPTSGTASGNASISVAAGNYTDAAGNAGGAGATPALSIDTLAPTLAITSNDAALKIGETATITFTFSEAPSGFTSDDITTTGGTLSGLAVSPTDAKVYTATFTPTVGLEGSASITVAAASYTDAAGNTGAAGATPVVGIDTLAPSITINPITGDNVINASEYTNAVSVSGTATGADGQTVTVSLNNQTYTGTVSSGAWSVSVPVGAVGALSDLTTYPVTANVSDLAGNPAAQASQNVLIAISGPVIQINPISVDNFINAAENSAAVVISGTVSGADGQTLTLNLNGQPYTSVVTGGAWSVTVDAGIVGALADGNYPVTANVSDSTGNPAQPASVNLVVDTQAPTLAITSNDTALISGETATITFTFSEAPSGFTAADISTTGGTLSGLAVSPTDAKVYTATFTPTPGTASSNASITVAAGSYSDAAGNAGGAGATPTISIDTLAPTLAITSNVAAVKIGETATLTFTFSEVPVGFAAGDVSTTGGSLSNLAVSGDPLVYTATFTPTVGFEGNAGISVAAGNYTDAAGNNGGAGATPALVVDTLAPTLAITSNDAALNIGETATISFTFSEAPSGFTADDITTTGGTLSGLAVSPTDAKVYTATFTPTPGTASGAASITVAASAYTDAAGNNGGAGATPAISIDTLAPTLAITSNVAAVKIGETATVTFTFSEAPVGFEAGDVATTGGTLSNLAVTGDAKVYTATFTPTAGFEGNAGISVAAGNYTDAAGNNGGAGTTPAISIDTLAPTQTVGNVDISADTGSSASDFVTQTAAQTITGTLSAPLATGDTLFGSVDNGATWTDITAKVVGTAITWDGATLAGSSSILFKISDAVGNTGANTGAQAYTLDTTAPTQTVSAVDISADTGVSDADFYTSTAAQTITGTLSNPLAAGDTLSGSVDNGVSWTDITANVSGTSINWTGATLAGNDTIGFKVTDSAGNDGANTGTQPYTVDTTNPVFTSGTSTAFPDQGTGTAYTAAATDAGPVSYSLTGTDAALFDIDTNTGAVTFKTPPSSAAPSDAGADNVYNFNAVATDPAGNSSSQAVAITVVNAPTLLPSALDDVTNFEVTSNIVLNYSEAVSAVAGKFIRIVNDGGTGFRGESAANTQIIEVTDTTQVSISGGKVTLNPTFDLDLANTYHIEIDDGAFTGTGSGLATAALDDNSSLNFATVTPGGFALVLAAASQAMDADGEMVAGRQWLDIEGIGNPSGSANTPLDLSGGNYALVAKDYDPEGADANSGHDGIRVGNLFVGANEFAAGDLIYIDDQTNDPANANDLSMTIVSNDGAAPTTVQLAGVELGGFIDITLAGNSAGYDTIALMQAALGTTAILSA